MRLDLGTRERLWLTSMGREITEDLSVGFGDKKGFSRDVILYSALSKAARGTDLCHVKISCNFMRFPGLTWSFASLGMICKLFKRQSGVRSVPQEKVVVLEDVL